MSILIAPSQSGMYQPSFYSITGGVVYFKNTDGRLYFRVIE